MKEQIVRERVAEAMCAWLGGEKGGAQHLDIIETYNSYKPLARNYAMTVKDDYCCATASAAFIKAGIAAYTGTECSCGELIKIAQARGIWVEDDAYAPGIGDAILYAWKDTGVGDNTTGHDHIGIVIGRSGNTITVGEGNMSGGKIGKRTMTVNGRYIRGYICPDYAKIAADETKREEEEAVRILRALPDESCYEIMLRARAYEVRQALEKYSH